MSARPAALLPFVRSSALFELQALRVCRLCSSCLLFLFPPCFIYPPRKLRALLCLFSASTLYTYRYNNIYINARARARGERKGRNGRKRRTEGTRGRGDDARGHAEMGRADRYKDIRGGRGLQISPVIYPLEQGQNVDNFRPGFTRVLSVVLSFCPRVFPSVPRVTCQR